MQTIHRRTSSQARASSSNAAACRDLQPGQVALGPSICGELYNLDTLAEHVQDFEGARTEFLVIAPRDVVQDLNARAHRNNADDFETIITFIPLVTGPGVLADLLDVLRDAGLNMTSFISRPIKGNDGTYSFIATLDAAPREQVHAVLEEIAEHGDWAKTLAVYHVVNVPARRLMHGCCPKVVSMSMLSIRQKAGSTPKRQEGIVVVNTVGIIGLGLIGGSLARRLAERGIRVVAWNHRPHPYAQAEADGIFCKSTLAELMDAEPDVVVLCNPLKAMPAMLDSLAPLMGEHPRTTITDVGSVKGMVREQVEAAGLGECYVGAHRWPATNCPVAGCRPASAR